MDCVGRRGGSKMVDLMGQYEEYSCGCKIRTEGRSLVLGERKKKGLNGWVSSG